VIETLRGSNGWVLRVSDSGGGIAAQDLVKASRPFVRLDPARGGSGHSGLGLAIVDRLVRRAGGECDIRNREEGGLEIAMTFPFDVVAKAADQLHIDGVLKHA
jgi:two-component system osmolarity sensor histidine kinase EnvZ